MASAVATQASAKQRQGQLIVVGVVGGFVLVISLAIQLPKLLGGSSSAQAAQTVSSPSTGQPAAVVTSLAEVIRPERAPVAGVEQLAVFTRFRAKDPFKQQVDPTEAAASASTQPLTGTPAASASSPSPTVSPKAPTPKPAVVLSWAVLSVNGRAEAVAVSSEFPKANEMFVLAALNPGGTAQIGIAGGSLASGAKTIKVDRSKPLTLVNTSDGTRYEIRLIAVGSGSLPASLDQATAFSTDS